MFIAPQKRVVIKKSIAPSQRDSIRFDGKAYLGLVDADSRFVEEVLDKYIDESWFDVSVKLHSLDDAEDQVLNSHGCVPLNGRLTISKTNREAKFSGEASLSKDVWLKMASDLTDNYKHFALDCESIDGVVESQDATSFTCRVQLSLREYSLEFHLPNAT